MFLFGDFVLLLLQLLAATIATIAVATAAGRDGDSVVVRAFQRRLSYPCAA
jgi:hypothetical protein